MVYDNRVNMHLYPSLCPFLEGFTWKIFFYATKTELPLSQKDRSHTEVMP